MSFAYLSIINLRTTPFLSLIVYETDFRGISTVKAEIARPYTTLNDLLEDLYCYDVSTVETDSKAIYHDLITLSRFPTTYKYEIDFTREQITRNKKILIEIFEPPGYVANWRIWCIDKLEKVIQILKTKGINTDD